MVNTLCIVQARLTSSRLPEKVLMELGDSKLSILEHVNMRLNKSSKIDKVVFAIPDTPLNDKLADFLDKKKIEHYRGSENDVLGRFYHCAEKYSPKLIVRATCDNPCVDWRLADEMIEGLGDADYMYCKETPLGTSVEVLTSNALNEAFYHAKAPEEREHVCPYITRRNEKFICKQYPYNKLSYRLTVDEEADYELMNEIYKQLYEGVPIENQKIYDYLKDHHALTEINEKVEQKRI